MAEVVGVVKIGETSSSEIFSNTAPYEIISAVFPGGAALSLAKGTALKDSATAGEKAAYTNADISPTGLCILLDDVTTTATSGSFVANALVMGTVNTAKIKDATGAAVDAAFKSALPKVRFA